MSNKQNPHHRKIQYHEHDEPRQELFPDISNVASASECTGLMHRSPNNEDELESYRQLSSMAIPRKEPGRPAPPRIAR